MSKQFSTPNKYHTQMKKSETQKKWRRGRGKFEPLLRLSYSHYDYFDGFSVFLIARPFFRHLTWLCRMLWAARRGRWVTLQPPYLVAGTPWILFRVYTSPFQTDSNFLTWQARYVEIFHLYTKLRFQSLGSQKWFLLLPQRCYFWPILR